MKKYSCVLLLTSLVLCAGELSKEVKPHQNLQKQKKVLQAPQEVKVQTAQKYEEQKKRKTYPRGVIETH
ncbi:MAG: hypothetical protein PHQ90_06510 [Sulfuricurvum sp.]|uniref:hypothetical protein n=1 Tax=Sulfuricurvum sp. TaxID=2025608 RepID=UPI00260ED17B|nr:hypothetical protein [Sulfuricurvum sp.]MDD2368938.1 hypothetical protein [Sulfuricurvum sp.]MDD2951037.1 hypothetical protein [Sulfuricurvum sp.]MDD5118175.1 hypothetical protein [Sulfuricurvum sp.]